MCRPVLREYASPIRSHYRVNVGTCILLSDLGKDSLRLSITKDRNGAGLLIMLDAQ
ncbi:MAG: hypothetical protein SH809_21005 [Rhodothermales bacterium]|nr:hypothetical protein [Rhodothermales bacterium]